MERKSYIKPEVILTVSIVGESLMDGGSVHGPGSDPDIIKNGGQSKEDDEAYGKQFTYDPDWSDYDDGFWNESWF